MVCGIGPVCPMHFLDAGSDCDLGNLEVFRYLLISDSIVFFAAICAGFSLGSDPTGYSLDPVAVNGTWMPKILSPAYW